VGRNPRPVRPHRAARNLQADYNIRADTDTIDVVKAADGGATELVPVRWG